MSGARWIKAVALLGLLYAAAARDEFLWVIESGIDYESSLAFAESHLDEVMPALE